VAKTDDAWLERNRALWEEWTPIHARSEFYDLESFKRGGIRLRKYEIEEVGPVSGKDLLHLQCHFGIDTLSWARLGAHVTGADFSPRAVALAASLAEELGLDARFLVSNVYDLPSNLDGEFDVVYTSRGAINWLPDIRGWARVAAHFVRPGGIVYMTELHPVAGAFMDEGVKPGELQLAYPYWEDGSAVTFDVTTSYADENLHHAEQKATSFGHGLGEIVNALIDAGLRIESLREFPFVDWKLDFLVQGDDGLWRLPGELDGRMPLFFSLRASRPG
jgi:SAM-dependent methyltransferase